MAPMQPPTSQGRDSNANFPLATTFDEESTIPFLPRRTEGHGPEPVFEFVRGKQLTSTSTLTADYDWTLQSDHGAFHRAGIPFVYFGVEDHEDYHQPSDEIDTIDFAHMTDAIRSMLEPIRWLANATFKPAWLPGQKPQ